ncbi:hypothetical protein PIB30_104276 [Stylosanthes scabra]|uniref:Uncharacterized protein n=1 Tax=Stylosanthes scabra TaxID=79078 RepID=A0ABU6ZX10_9FABA|nr:hypothetical protein [Stylosanthes scabra]
MEEATSTTDNWILYFKDMVLNIRKIEERKLADQETEFGSKTEQGSTHMRGRARICVLLIPQPTPK